MDDTLVAKRLMESLPISLTDAVRLVLEMVENLPEPEREMPNLMVRCRRVIRLGTKALAQEDKTVTLARAVEETLLAKSNRSQRTRQDIRSFYHRLVRMAPETLACPLRSINTAECARLLSRIYATDVQRRKGRAILSSVFSFCRRRGWCGENPVSFVDVPQVKEKEIRPLSLSQVHCLVRTAKKKAHRACLPALALMLYAGVRPNEMQRLTWASIDWEEREIIIPARHSKTGGGRHIAIQPVLLSLLEGVTHHAHQRICPPNWRLRWKRLREEAGFTVWVQDVLRHTFASYYAKFFRDVNALQLYMGHRDPHLLYTRYINMAGIDRSSARLFWELCP